MTFKSALAGLAAVAALSCALRPTPGRIDPVYFPMEADRIWEYRLHEIVRQRVWPISVRSRGLRFVPELRQVAAIFDEEYPDQTVPVAFFLSGGFLQSDIGLGYRGNERTSLLPIGSEPMRLMPVPPAVGMRWTYSEEVFSGSGRLDPGLAIDWTGVVHGEESLEVPAGTFRGCLRVESVAAHRVPKGLESREHRYVDWYAPGVGLVKSEYSSGKNEPTVTRMELVSYRVAPLPLLPASRGMQMARN